MSETVYIVDGLDYLLTWNCQHIANAQIQKKLAQISGDTGYELPTTRAPYELMGESTPRSKEAGHHASLFR